MLLATRQEEKRRSFDLFFCRQPNLAFFLPVVKALAVAHHISPTLVDM